MIGRHSYLCGSLSCRGVELRTQGLCIHSLQQYFVVNSDKSIFKIHFKIVPNWLHFEKGAYWLTDHPFALRPSWFIILLDLHRCHANVRYYALQAWLLSAPLQSLAWGRSKMVVGWVIAQKLIEQERAGRSTEMQSSGQALPVQGLSIALICKTFTTAPKELPSCKTAENLAYMIGIKVKAASCKPIKCMSHLQMEDQSDARLQENEMSWMKVRSGARQETASCSI